MEQKLFLERNRSVFSNDVERTINVGLSTKTRLLPNDNVSDNFSLFEQYNRERDECNKIRLILNVNPVCSNVLYNARTEIVLNEGSSACTLLIGQKSLAKETYAPNAVNTTSSIKYMDAIRNTEYSHPENGGFVYHCGFDIFNNHMLRKKEFVHVNKIDDEEDDGKNYNTIRDYCRDGRGHIVKEEIGISITKAGTTDMHLYQYDTIMSMPTAFMDNCIEKDGWWGFTNPSTIEIPNSDDKSVSINRMMANNKSCEFIDLYPDRSLYSFIPKFNKHRRRLEKNWDYCITYPYKSDFETLNVVCGGEQQAIRANMKQRMNGAGQPVVECSSYFKHNLKPGNYVTFYYYMPHYKILVKDVNGGLKYWKNDEGEFLYKESDFDINGLLKKEHDGPVRQIMSKTFTRYSIKVKVDGIGDANGDHTDRIFVVKYNDIREIYEYMLHLGCFYKKNNGNTDCLYYFRKFKKLTNVDGGVIKSDVNKVAFGKNIYGDDVAQVIFTDDIDINGLLDHNGRPVSELYFTIVKRNAGYKEWYEKKNYSGDTVEFSHCFGEVTSAIDFCGIEDEPFDYNIHMAHNLSRTANDGEAKKLSFSAWGETILSGTPKTLERNITIENDEYFGDIVEYDIYKATETVIGNVYHRFNTAQREFFGTDFQHILQDVIVSDDYDKANGEGKAFSCVTYYVNNVKNPISTKGDSNSLMYGNISPEGYYYNPHMKLQVRENDDVETTSSAKYVNYSQPTLRIVRTYLLIKEDGTIEIYNSESDANANKKGNDVIVLQSSYYEINMKVPVNYGFYKGDYIAFYDKQTSDVAWGEIVNVSGSYLTINIDSKDFDMVDAVTLALFDPQSGGRRFYAYWSTYNTPVYAKLCEGTRKFVWRKIVPPSQMMQDDELYNLPFTNGRFYLEKNINFFLKRQDPVGKYGLSIPIFKIYKQTVSNPMVRFGIDGHNPIDFSEIMFVMNNINNNCF